MQKQTTFQKYTGTYIKRTWKEHPLKTRRKKEFRNYCFVVDDLHILKPKGHQGQMHLQVLKQCPLHVTGDGK
jgi:hypothetical protein